MKKLLLATMCLPLMCSCTTTNNSPYLDKVKEYYHHETGVKIIRESYEYLGCTKTKEYEHYYYYVDIVRNINDYGIEHRQEDLILYYYIPGAVFGYNIVKH